MIFATVIAGRTEVSVVRSEGASDVTPLFDVWVDGDYSPSIGVGQDGFIAIWAGTGAALSGAAGWKEIDTGYAIHAVYRVASGWCLVSELSVMTVDDDGALAAERLHREVILTSRWDGPVLIVKDFAKLEWCIFVNKTP
jgi:hypothetical protein